MRPYERLRAGELAGTTGSRTPSFPVQRAESINPPLDQPDVIGGISSSPRAVGTRGNAAAAPPVPAAPPPAHVVIQTIPAPTGAEGVWVEFQGMRWYHAGRPVSHDRDRFETIGSYRGFEVFKEKSGGTDTIYVAAVRDGGPLTPYSIKR
jgi:hypothetical protein